MLSLPSRERGLKYESYDAEKNGGQSLPSRERGLKSTGIDAYKNVRSVAPFAGAWIEILL